MAHYLVTGGAGFIGSHLAEELVRRGETVRVVDNLSTGKRQNLSHVPSVEFIEGDLADLDVARRAVKGIDYVLHQAAIPSVPRSIAYHGVALNVSTDLSYFAHIVPCRGSGLDVTSFAQLLPAPATVAQVGAVFASCFAAEMGFTPA